MIREGTIPEVETVSRDGQKPKSMTEDTKQLNSTVHRILYESLFIPPNSALPCCLELLPNKKESGRKGDSQGRRVIISREPAKTKTPPETRQKTRASVTPYPCNA